MLNFHHCHTARTHTHSQTCRECARTHKENNAANKPDCARANVRRASRTARQHSPASTASVYIFSTSSRLQYARARSHRYACEWVSVCVAVCVWECSHFRVVFRTRRHHGPRQLGSRARCGWTRFSVCLSRAWCGITLESTRCLREPPSSFGIRCLLCSVSGLWIRLRPKPHTHTLVRWASPSPPYVPHLRSCFCWAKNQWVGLYAGLYR